MWMLHTLVFLLLLIVAYFSFKFVTSVEKISHCVCDAIKGVNDVTEPTISGFRSLFSALNG